MVVFFVFYFGSTTADPALNQAEWQRKMVVLELRTYYHCYKCICHLTNFSKCLSKAIHPRPSIHVKLLGSFMCIFEK